MTDAITAPTPADAANTRPWLGQALVALAAAHHHDLTADTGARYRDELVEHHRQGMSLGQIHDALLASVAHDNQWPTIARLRELLRWACHKDAPPSRHAPVQRAEPEIVRDCLTEARALLNDAKRRRVNAQYQRGPDPNPAA